MGLNATDEELEELRRSILLGAQSVEADGRKVVYRSLDDQIRIQQLAEEEQGRSRRRLTVFSRGYK